MSVVAANVSAAVSNRFAPTRNAAPAFFSVPNTAAKIPVLPNIPRKDFLNPSIGFVKNSNTFAPCSTPSLSPFVKPPPFFCTLPALSMNFLPNIPSRKPCPLSVNLVKNPPTLENAFPNIFLTEPNTSSRAFFSSCIKLLKRIAPPNISAIPAPIDITPVMVF